jgi:hypothetical protein
VGVGSYGNLLYPDEFQRSDINAIGFETKCNYFPSALHQGVKIFRLRVAARHFRHGGDVIAFLVAFNNNREFALGLHQVILSLGSSPREEYAGVILSLARQEKPDTSGYNDPEVAVRIKKHHHAGLVLRSGNQQRVQLLLENYVRRFAEEFMAVQPPREKPSA